MSDSAIDLTASGLSRCSKLVHEEIHYVDAILDCLKRAAFLGGTPNIHCEARADIGPARCQRAAEGVPSDSYYSYTFPEAETRVRLDLDGYNTYLKSWNDVPRSGQRFKFTICAQRSKSGVQAVGGCAKVALDELLQGDPAAALSMTNEADYVQYKAGWCKK